MDKNNTSLNNNINKSSFYKDKTILMGMTLSELELWCEMQKQCITSLLKLDKTSNSKSEKTKKYLFRLLDNNLIETVSMIEGEKHTVCISSQVGCNVGCTFCATATMGFIRNLSTGEILEQLDYVRNNINERITNVVFMGMGEPFLNYKNVIKAADIFNSKEGYGLGANRITISTAGILPKIKDFINNKIKYKLAISLNASNNLTRSEIMPINKTWNINDVILFLKNNNSLKKNIMFEYVLLKNINDSIEDACRLAKLLNGIKCKLNIIPYNEIQGEYTRPDENTIEVFIKTLIKKQKTNSFIVLVRWSKGQDIDAGCGQLAILNK